MELISSKKWFNPQHTKYEFTYGVHKATAYSTGKGWALVQGHYENNDVMQNQPLVLWRLNDKPYHNRLADAKGTWKRVAGTSNIKERPNDEFTIDGMVAEFTTCKDLRKAKQMEEAKAKGAIKVKVFFRNDYTEFRAVDVNDKEVLTVEVDV